MDRNRRTISTLFMRMCFSALGFLVLIGAFASENPRSSFALDPLPRSPRRLPLPSYEQVPIGKLLSDPASYHLREIRIAGAIRTIQTELMTQGCAMPYELTIFTVEDDSGLVEVLDMGACGRNRSVTRAPMLAPGDHVSLLIQVVGTMNPDGPKPLPELVVLWIDLAQDQ